MELWPQEYNGSWLEYLYRLGFGAVNYKCIFQEIYEK